MMHLFPNTVCGADLPVLIKSKWNMAQPCAYNETQPLSNSYNSLGFGENVKIPIGPKELCPGAIRHSTNVYKFNCLPIVGCLIVSYNDSTIPSSFAG
jgi:hypothetical protein